MARQKKNADYFSHSATLRSKDTILAVRRKFGIEGYGIYIMLQERLTDENYWRIEFNELTVEVLAGDFGIGPERLREMLEYFIMLKLLELKEGYLEDPRLTESFDGLIEYREKKRQSVADKRKQHGNGTLDNCSEDVPGNIALDKIRLDKIRLDKQSQGLDSVCLGDVKYESDFKTNSTNQTVKELKEALASEVSPTLTIMKQDVTSGIEMGKGLTNQTFMKQNVTSASHTNSGTTTSDNVLTRPEEASFEDFWMRYDKQVGKEFALRAWKELDSANRMDALSYLPGYIETTPNPKFRKNPARFLEEKAWMDKLYHAKPQKEDRKNVSKDYSKYKTN